jgi:hypothetical protein
MIENVPQPAPPPNEIMQDIQVLKERVAAIRDRQKKIA